MRMNLDMNILRHMADGVVVLDRYAQIVAFNEQARPWVEPCQTQAQAIKRMIDEDRLGSLVLPVSVARELGMDKMGLHPQSNSSSAWLCKNGRSQYAIFVTSALHHQTAPSQVQGTTRHQPNLAVLLGSEVRDELSRLRELLHSRQGSQTLASATVEQQCRKVEQLMQEVVDLSQLLELDVVFASERLSITDILENILVSLPTRTSKADVHIRMLDEAPGPVYGDGAWLSYALRLLVSDLIAHAPSHSTVEITVGQMGEFLILTGGANPEQADPQRRSTGRHGSAAQQAAVAQATGIQMMMCRRIIELHAGQLRLTYLQPGSAAPLNQPQPGALASFTLTLMTSVPANDRTRTSCADCRHVQQEFAYAADLAQLMAGQATTISDRSLQP